MKKFACHNCYNGHFYMLVRMLLSVFFMFLFTIVNLDAKELIISKLTTPITIDADDTEWPGDWIAISENTNFSITDEMYAKFQLAYDDYNLYIITKVADSSPNNDENAIPNAWERDCIEVYIGMDTNSLNSGLYKEGDWQIRKQREPEEGGIDGYHGSGDGVSVWDIDSLKNNSNFKVLSSSSNNEYFQEWAIPWSALSKNWDGRQFKFEIAATDNSNGQSGGRTQLTFWNSNADMQWNNTKCFGLVMLETPIDSVGIIPPTIDADSIIWMNRSGRYTINAMTKLLDSGGEYGNYGNNEYYAVTVYPVDSSQKVNVTFVTLNLENCCDNISIYDGENESSMLIGSYNGSSLPDDVVASNARGALTFVFKSDGSVTGSGFKAFLNPSGVKIAPSTLNLTSEDTVTNFAIIAKDYNWAITENYNWLSVNKNTGSGIDTVILYTKTNSLSYQRTAKLTITFTDTIGNKSVSQLNIFQAAQDYYVKIPDSIVNVPWNSDSTICVNIKSNTNWYIYSSDYSWLSFNSENFEGDKTIKVYASNNHLLSERSAYLYVSWYDKNWYWHSKQIRFVQSAAPIGVYANELFVGYRDSSTASLSIVADSCNWSISTKDQWISLNIYTGNTDSVVTITALENPSAFARYGNIVFFYEINDKPDSFNITIKQGPSPAYLEVPDTIYMKSGNNSIADLVIKSNVNWYIYSNNIGNWLSYNNEYPNLSNDTIKLQAMPNPYTYSRTGSLFIEWYDSSYYWNNKAIYIIQAASQIGVSSTELTIAAKEGSTSSFNVKSNGVGWNLKCTADWLYINPMSGSNDETISIVANENTNAYDRFATIYYRALTGTANSVDIPIFVTQIGRYASFNVSTNNIVLNEYNPTEKFYIESNTEWQISADWWINYSYEGSSSGNKTVTVSSAYNDNNYSGYIYIYWNINGNWNSTSIYVTQNYSGQYPIDNYLSIYKLNNSPVIDGKLSLYDEWDKIPSSKISKARDSMSLIEADFKMCYDDSNIYVLMNIYDLTPNQEGASSWQSDCVDLYFGMDTSNSDMYREGDWQIRKVDSKTQADGGVDGSVNVMDVLLNDPNFKVVQQEGYPIVQEWQLPISTLVQSAYFNGEYFRFDAGVADNDGTGNNRTGLYFWNSSIDDQWNSIKNQGYIRMAGSIDNMFVLSKSESYFEANSCMMDTIIVNSYDSLTALCAEDWVHFDYYDGEIKFLTIWVDKNSSNEKRTGFIKLDGWNKHYEVKVIQSSTTGINSISTDIDIYPNPVTDYLNIKSNSISSVVSLALFNLDGKQILLNNTGVIDEKINVNSLASGIYIARISFRDGSVINKKIIKK